MRSNSRIGRAHRHVLMQRASSGETPASNWYDGALVAYQPLGAASYGDSKINLANPGTYDAVEGIAPSWESETGWDFNGVDQFLDSGLVPDCDGTWSMIVRFSDADSGRTGDDVVAGQFSDSRFQISLGSSSDNVDVGNGDNSSLSAYGSGITSGVYGFAGKNVIDNGSFVGTIPAGSATASNTVYVGAFNHSTRYYLPGKIQSIGIWDYTLTPTEVATISAAMAAL